MKTLGSLLALGFSLSIVACSGDADEESGPNIASNGSALTVVEQCAGEVSCNELGTPTIWTEALRSDADGCHLGSKTTLAANGVVAEAKDSVWVSTALDFTVCGNGRCIACTPTPVAGPAELQ